MTCTIIGIIVSCVGLQPLSPQEAADALQKVSPPYVATTWDPIPFAWPEVPDMRTWIPQRSTLSDESWRLPNLRRLDGTSIFEPPTVYGDIYGRYAHRRRDFFTQGQFGQRPPHATRDLQTEDRNPSVGNHSESHRSNSVSGSSAGVRSRQR